MGTDEQEPYFGRLERTLARLFPDRVDLDEVGSQRGIAPFVLRELLASDPLAAFIPSAYGGRGARASDCLRVLELVSYESLPLGLMLGIGGALFLAPIAKYGQDAAKAEVFARALDDHHLGGLMITEPDYGSDALNIQTHFTSTAGGYRLRGVKHWAGLTGWADAWLLAARERSATGSLSVAPSLFICAVANPGQAIEVEARFPNLGLHMIPYGRNRIDVSLPAHHRLDAPAGGLRMLRDVLHRTRSQFPGLALGFLRRVFDEATHHCQRRFVGGRPLAAYDLVAARLARIQAAVTATSAMCVHASQRSGLELDLSGEVILANAIKASVTDFMFEAADSTLQLSGAAGYRLDHFAGRAFVDSRAFQIFEGSNDILYKTIGETLLRSMRRARTSALSEFLRALPETARAAELLGARIELRVEAGLDQRKLWALGALVSRVCVLEMVIELGERGYCGERIHAASACLAHEIEDHMNACRTQRSPTPVPNPGPHWSTYLPPHTDDEDDHVN